MTSLLSVSDLAVAYDRAGARHVVLERFSLSLGEGDCLALLGPNGCGKSTLLHAIAGTVQGRATGRIAVDGRDLMGVPAYRRAAQIALVHQDPSRGTAAHLSLEEHCRLTAATGARRAVSWREAQARLRELDVPLDGARLAGELSGGQRQLFTVVLAVLSRPRVLLLDEPTAALDVRHQRQVQEVIRDFAAEGASATVLVTHDPGEALATCNRLVMLSSHGRAHLDLAGAALKGRTSSDLVQAMAEAIAASWG